MKWSSGTNPYLDRTEEDILQDKRLDALEQIVERFRQDFIKNDLVNRVTKLEKGQGK